MSSIQKDLTVYIGRFSPFHRGHSEVLKNALLTSKRVLILIGSADQPRTVKNPFTWSERGQMIEKYIETSPSLKDLPKGENKPYDIQPIVDIPYNDTMWLSQVQGKVEKYITQTGLVNPTVYLTGANRDDSSYYLNLFPNYKLDLATEDINVSQFLSATTVREIYFGRKFNGIELRTSDIDMLLRSFVPAPTIEFLTEFEKTTQFSDLVEEYNLLKRGKKAWENAPYPPIFVTVDAVVVQAGHVLLVRRRANPGKGLYALPGGFLEQGERLLDGAIRELREETRLKVPVPVLKGSMIRAQYFDQPGRSLRGRTVTHAFLFKLAELGELPPVKGSDDAEKAVWVPLSQVANMRSVLFEDHYDIIHTMIGGTL